MADPDVTMKGILGVNDSAPPNGTTGYYLDHVAIEVDVPEMEGLNPGPEGLPINVEGHFEVHGGENPDSPVRYVSKAYRAYGDPGNAGGMSSVPPPNQ